MKKFFIYLFLAITLNAESNTINISIDRSINSLNPQGYGENLMSIQNLVFEGLVRIDKKGAIIPHLATSWEILDSGKVYIFKLKKGVKFSNGEDFNAQAVKINFDSILKNKEVHGWTGLVNLIQSSEVLDSHTFKLTLKSAYTPTLNELALIRPYRFLAPSAMPKDLDLIKNKPLKPIGTGVYELVESKYGISATLKANKFHSTKPYFETIQAIIINEPNARFAALAANKIDLIYGLSNAPIELFKQAKLNPNFKTYVSPPISNLSFLFNSTKLDLNVRKALFYAINKEAINNAVFNGIQPQSNTILNTESKPHKFIYSKQKAKEILESSGYVLKNGFYYLNNTRLSIDFLYIANNPTHKYIAQILASQLKEVGIYLQLVPSEISIYSKKQYNGDFMLTFSETWGAPYEPIIMLNSMRVKGHADYSAQLGLESKTLIDQKIKDLLSNTKQTQLESKVNEILNLLYESYIYLPLSKQVNRAIANKKIKGIDIGVNAFEIPIFEFYE